MLKQKQLLLLFIFTSFISLTVIIWATNKGFNLSDEGFYITGYNNLIEFPFWLSSFHFLTNNTLSNIGSGILFFRIARLPLTILGSIFLSYSLWRLLKKYNFINRINEKATRIALGLFGLIGSFIGYGFGPQALSYNHYTLILGNLFLGFIFLAFTHSNNVKRNVFFSIVLGIICGFEFFVKIPTTFLLSLLFFGAQVLLFKHLRWFSFINIFLFALFALLSFSFISFPASPISVLDEYLYVISFISKFYSHDISYVLQNYKIGILDFWNCHLINYIPALCFLLIASYIAVQNRFIKIKPVGKFLLIFILLSIVYSLFRKGYFLSGSQHNSTAPLVYIISIFLFIALSILLFIKHITKFATDFFLEKLFVVLSLLFFPIICAMGTGNYLHVQILFFLNTWFFFIYLIYLFFELEKTNLNIGISILLITLTVKSTFDLVTGLVIDPYKINGPLWEQTEPLKISLTNETILIDKKLMNTIKTLQPIMEKQNPDAFFTSSQLLGLSYIFNKKLIGYAWYDSGISPKEFFYQSYNQSVLKEKNNICFMLLSAENNYKIFDYLSDGKTTTKLITIPWENDSIFVYSRHN